LSELARNIAGHSGADVEAVCREAAMNALRRDIDSKQVTLQDFKEAMVKIKPSITSDMDAWYLGFGKRFKKERVAIPVT